MPDDDATGKRPTCEDPFALMRACHRRIEQRLGLMQGLADRLGNGDPAVRAEALAVLESLHAFLSTTGIHHTADEDEDLYPLLRETRDPECLRALDELEQDHLRLEPVLVAFDRLAGRLVEAEVLDEQSVSALGRLLVTMGESYRAHILHEEETLYPRAETLLTPEQIARLSRGMRERRGVCPASGSQDVGATTACFPSSPAKTSFPIA